MAGFGNLIDGQHPIWIADFTGASYDGMWVTTVV
jgi:hypothetical protein